MKNCCTLSLPQYTYCHELQIKLFWGDHFLNEDHHSSVKQYVLAFPVHKVEIKPCGCTLDQLE